MKKTLVALAVLAASGASFAQVAITGTVAMGYAASTSETGAQKSGLGVDTTVLNFAASEDLGGGLKASAALGFDGVNRGGVGGGDTSFALSSAAYTITVASTQLGPYLAGGNAIVGGNYVNGWDGRVFSANNLQDWAQVKVPFGAVTVALTHYEGSGNTLGLANGSTGSAAARQNLLTASYASGALAADIGFASFDNQAYVSSTNVNITNVANTNNKSRARGAVSYDFGAVKVGAGIDSYTLVAGTKNDVAVSINVPVGALSLGANVVSRAISGTSAKNAVAASTAGNPSTNGTDADGTFNGFSVGASYALSKTTSIGLQYQSWQQADKYAGNQSNLTELLLSKSF